MKRRIDAESERYSFDHHGDCVRHATRSTAEQVHDALVLGLQPKYLTALLTLDPEVAPRWAADHGITGDLVSSEAIRRELAAHMEVVNAEVSRVEGIKKYTLLPRPFSIPDGELTPTLKVKRKVVYAHFAAEIEAMYLD